MPSLEAVGYKNLDINAVSEKRLRYFFFMDLDSVDKKDAYEYIQYMGDLLSTSGGYLIRSHKSYSLDILGKLLNHCVTHFKNLGYTIDYYYQTHDNLILRSSPKVCPDNMKIISPSPKLEYCINKLQCPYQDDKREFLRRRYLCNW